MINTVDFSYQTELWMSWEGDLMLTLCCLRSTILSSDWINWSWGEDWGSERVWGTKLYYKGQEWCRTWLDPKFQDSFPLLDVLDYHPDLESVMISVFGTTLICRNSQVAEILGAETEFRCTTLDMKAPEHVRLYMRYLSLKKEI